MVLSRGVARRSYPETECGDDRERPDEVVINKRFRNRVKVLRKVRAEKEEQHPSPTSLYAKGDSKARDRYEVTKLGH